MPSPGPSCWIALAAGLAAASSAFAQVDVTLDPVVVSATRAERASFDVPASVDAVAGAALRDAQAQVNLSESLARVPGVVVLNRQNYAQDLQISTRGFGARTTFGVRGVFLVADGIPATMPDGQGQAASFDLGSAQRIEVMRGPFSTLYGNSAGGVIQIFTEDGPADAMAQATAFAGSYGSRRLALLAGGTSGSFNYLANLARFETDGYRDHSAATRDTANAKLRLDLGAAGIISLVGSALSQGNTQDPLGLSKTQVQENPRQADATATAFNTRKCIAQQQAGLIYERSLGGDAALRAMAYSGTRRVEQFQAIPVAAQANPLHPGGVVDLDRGYSGVDLRLSDRILFAGNPLTFVAGVNQDVMREHRQGFQNFIGAVTGIKGALRRDEDNRVTNQSIYLQGELRMGARWLLLAGLRSSVVKFSSLDRYVTGVNPDDSGGVRYANTSPVAGIIHKVTTRLNLYANAGRGFETPTFNELAYRVDGLSGLNFGLKPSVSDQFETGIKFAPDAATRITAALFRNRARDEIAVLTNSGGRATYQNAGASRREGAEFFAARAFGAGFSASLAYTYVTARYLDGFLACAGSACATPATAVPAGNRMPGVPRHSAYAELAWRDAGGWFAAIEARAIGAIAANDVNSEYAAGYAVANLRAGLEQHGAGWRISEFARLDNALNRGYVGSVIVSEANGRYYEPAARRGAMIGISARIAL